MQNMIAGERSANDSGITSKHKVSAAMVRMIVSVHDPANRCRRDFPDLRQQLFSLHFVQSGIHDENAGVAHKKSRVGTGIIAGDVGVERSEEHTSELQS